MSRSAYNESYPEPDERLGPTSPSNATMIYPCACCNTQNEQRAKYAFYMGKHKVDSQIIFYPLLEWTNRYCGCVELVEYILFNYLHDAFGVWCSAARLDGGTRGNGVDSP